MPVPLCAIVSPGAAAQEINRKPATKAMPRRLMTLYGVFTLPSSRNTQELATPPYAWPRAFLPPFRPCGASGRAEAA